MSDGGYTIDTRAVLGAVGTHVTDVEQFDRDGGLFDDLHLPAGALGALPSSDAVLRAYRDAVGNHRELHGSIGRDGLFHVYATGAAAELYAATDEQNRDILHRVTD